MLQYDGNLMKNNNILKIRIFLKKKASSLEVSYLIHTERCSPVFTASETILYVIQSNTVQCSRQFQYIKMCRKTPSLSSIERISTLTASVFKDSKVKC